MSGADIVRGVPLIGDIAGGFGLQTDAERKKQNALEDMLKMLSEYRPEAMQQRQNSIDHAFKLFQPVNRALVNAYGQDAALPIAEATASPTSDEVMAGLDSRQASREKAAETAHAAKKLEAFKKSHKKGFNGPFQFRF